MMGDFLAALRADCRDKQRKHKKFTKKTQSTLYSIEIRQCRIKSKITSFSVFDSFPEKSSIMIGFFLHVRSDGNLLLFRVIFSLPKTI